MTANSGCPQDGGYAEFVEDVQYVSFNVERARATGQQVLYSTERAVPAHRQRRQLIEISPSVDLRRDAMNQMGFTPLKSEPSRLMDRRFFLPGPHPAPPASQEPTPEDPADGKVPYPMTDAFSGVRILDFTQLEQGPSATQVLADFGADVIKVERIDRGEIGRNQPPFLGQGYSPHWSATNRNKRSISVDVKSEDGRELILELARDADLVASNFRPGVMDRLGLGWEQLSAVNPRIIVAYASGYGISGPYMYRRGQDLAAQAMSGLMALTGSSESGPVPTGTFMIDYLASMQFAQGMMIALAARECTGRGQVVDSNLLNAAIASHLQEGTTYLNTGQRFPRPTGGVAHAHNTALYGCYQAADELWLALIGEFYVDEQWKRTARACGLPESVVEDPRFQTIEGLREHTVETHRLIADAVRTYPRDEIMARFEAEDVLVAPVHDYDAVFTDPQVQHNGLVLKAKVDGVGPVKFVGMPIALSETPARLRHVPPKIGEHNDEVLASSGLASERVRLLKDAGVVGAESDRERSGGPGAWS